MKDLEKDKEKEAEREPQSDLGGVPTTVPPASADKNRKSGDLYKLGLMGRKKKQWYAFSGHHLVWWDTQEEVSSLALQTKF